ncbi:MAG: hypothetical protein AB1589_20190 [Cyanobacteriota bacterium]
MSWESVTQEDTVELGWWVELVKGVPPFPDYFGSFASAKEAQIEGSELPIGFRNKGRKRGYSPD